MGIKWKQREILLDRYISDNMGGYNRSFNVQNIKKRAEISGEGDSFTVQYTGVKDINGKKIFEGDICHLESPYLDESMKGITVFHEACFQFKVTVGDKPEAYKHIIMWKKIWILGNVFQNPELVEKYGLEF